MYRIIILGLAAVLLGSPASAQTYQNTPDLYISAFLDQHSLGLNDGGAELQPVVVTAAFGYWVRDGIGLELEAGVGVTDDSVGSLVVDFGSKLGVNLRLESPPIERFAAYALVSYVRTHYKTIDNGLRSSLSLPGGRIAIGLTYLFTPKLAMDAAFSHHDYDGDTRINSFRLGMRFDFGS